MNIARFITVALLGAALVAPAVRAAEEFEQPAVDCASAALANFDPRNELAWFGAASLWARCLEDPVEAELDRVTDVAEIALGDDRKRLKSRREALRLASASVSFHDNVGAALANPDVDNREFKGYEKLALKLVIASSDLRLLGLESFRQMFLLVVGGLDARADYVMSEIDERLADLAEVEGADQTPQGQKALKLILLADTVREGISAQFDILTGISADAIPEFGAEQTREGKRALAIFKREARGMGRLLVKLRKIEGKIDKLVEKAVDKAGKNALCPFTDPDDPFEGGGWVRVSIDGAPEVELAGDTGVSFTSPRRRIVFMGSDGSVRPNVLFELYGKKTTRAGTYEVRDRPSSDDAFERDYAVGSYKVGRDVFWFVSGTLVIDTFKTGKKRLIEGSFDVVGRTDEGEERRLVGTYHLCRFGVEYREGIDLAD